MKQARKRQAFIGAAVLIALLGAAVFASKYIVVRWQGSAAAPALSSLDRLGAVQAPGKPAQRLWVCPMHAQILQDHPGSCPICGMDLVEQPDGHEHGMTAGVQVDNASIQRLGIRLAVARNEVMSREVDTYGSVAVDESSIVNVSPNAQGILRKLDVDYVGQEIHAGQALYEIYSEDLFQRQNEYIDLLTRQRQTLQNLKIPLDLMADEKQGALRQILPKQLSTQQAYLVDILVRDRIRLRDKLLAAGLSPGALDRVVKTGRASDVITVHASRSGFATQIGARVGSAVNAATNVVSMAGLSRVWVDVALYPEQLKWVKDGDVAIVKTSQGSEIKSPLRFVNPQIDQATRTLHARVVLDNPAFSLRPGEFVDVTVLAKPHKALVVPRTAIIRTGKGSRVMLAREQGHFLPVEVETGAENEEWVEVLDGLQEGAKVATNGQFLLDAAASLNDAAERMQSGISAR
ncbi:MAG: efflux RND transporter periplasmic adaptor subunit [Sulfuricellaceae bacterium]|nr:efflux RND transporter periplasmic adaptor subunit [Sulfuricellaceae bacterium]